MNYPQTGIYHLPASLYAVEEEHHASVWILYKHKGKLRLSMGSKINSRENLISSNFGISGKILLEKLEELYSQQFDWLADDKTHKVVTDFICTMTCQYKCQWEVLI